MVNILIVSHSHKLASSLHEFISEMKHDDFSFEYHGGIENGTVFGTDPIEIKDKVESMLAGTNDLLIICDLGSSIMNTQMALEFLEEEKQKRVAIADVPFLEGTLIAVSMNGTDVKLDSLKNDIESIGYEKKILS